MLNEREVWKHTGKVYCGTILIVGVKAAVSMLEKYEKLGTSMFESVEYSLLAAFLPFALIYVTLLTKRFIAAYNVFKFIHGLATYMFWLWAFMLTAFIITIPYGIACFIAIYVNGRIKAYYKHHYRWYY